MEQIREVIDNAGDFISLRVRQLLEEQRTELAGQPERVIRAMALQQMAEHYENKAQTYLNIGDTFEAQECRNIARHALEFKTLILEGRDK